MSETAALYNVSERRVPESRADRVSAVARARASARLEGGDLSPAAEALADRYVAGEMTSEQWVKETIRLYR